MRKVELEKKLNVHRFHISNKSIKKTKKAPAKAGAKSLRQVSYRQETYRAVFFIYNVLLMTPSKKFVKQYFTPYYFCKRLHKILLMAPLCSLPNSRNFQTYFFSFVVFVMLIMHIHSQNTQSLCMTHPNYHTILCLFHMPAQMQKKEVL